MKTIKARRFPEVRFDGKYYIPSKKGKGKGKIYLCENIAAHPDDDIKSSCVKLTQRLCWSCYNATIKKAGE